MIVLHYLKRDFVKRDIKGVSRIMRTAVINYSTDCHKSYLFLLNSQLRLLKMIGDYFLYLFTDSILTIVMSPEMRAWLKQQFQVNMKSRAARKTKHNTKNFHIIIKSNEKSSIKCSLHGLKAKMYSSTYVSIHVCNFFH